MNSDVLNLAQDGDGPVFREPWEAKAFAVAFVLHERGVFSWSEWTSVLAKEIERARAAGDPDSGDAYYRHWLRALERIITAKGIATSEMLNRYHDAWDAAADRTPHGKPIELSPQDFPP